MPNMEIAVMPSTPVAIIACAIHCCDNKVYTVTEHPPLSPCTSLGKKKDTCVRRNVKKALAKNKIKNVKVEPKETVTVMTKKGPKVFNCKPDFMVDNRIIDAKFPCDEGKLRPKLAPPGKPGLVQDRAVGAAKKTPKEKLAYPKMKGPDGKKVKSVRVMGPKEAAKKKGDCQCS
ncbi:hypothetical protein [Thauera sp. 2A1]|uniref:hypothetical protein n=1 Tax=Thauera sp. 2A1 TaxID=2570191 RepID=UPI001D173889|nr:hypothetical protein [Thauera sp. 2A1]KAI5916443.1 hypothetical protein GH664_03105 [Thauera sp. 2A1]